MSLDFIAAVAFMAYCGYCIKKKFAGAVENIDPKVKGEAKKLAGGLLMRMLKSRM